MRIITHPPDRINRDSSVFADELRLASRSGSVDIACPYLSVDLLQEVIQEAARFRLLTNAEAWLRAYARPQRRDIIKFVTRYPANVRHFRRLHAKVAVSKTRAFFGSANFTQSGLYEREELSASVEEATHVTVIRDWFDSLWERAIPISLSQLEEYERSLPATADGSNLPPSVLPPPSKKSSHRSVESPRPPLTSEQDFITYLKQWRIDSVWLSEYFDLMKILADGLGLGEDDHRLAVTMPRNGPPFPVSVNNRYCLSLPTKSDGRRGANRKSHSPVALRASLDDQYRASILSNAYPQELPASASTISRR